MDLSNYDLEVDVSLEKDVLAPGKHPNEKGSKILAEKLFSLISIDA